MSTPPQYIMCTVFGKSFSRNGPAICKNGNPKDIRFKNGKEIQSG